MSYAPPEILFQISKFDKILKSEITKIYDNYLSPITVAESTMYKHHRYFL